MQISETIPLAMKEVEPNAAFLVFCPRESLFSILLKGGVPQDNTFWLQSSLSTTYHRPQLHVICSLKQQEQNQDKELILKYIVKIVLLLRFSYIGPFA